MQTCPKSDCSIEAHVHGHGTDEMYLPKPTERIVMKQKPGSLESLLAEAFAAGGRYSAYWYGEGGSEPEPPDFDEWRRGMLPDPEDL